MRTEPGTTEFYPLCRKYDYLYDQRPPPLALLVTRIEMEPYQMNANIAAG